MALSTERPLDLNSTFPCPVCRQGKIQALILTDAFACEACRHILSANLAQQQVQVLDSSQPLIWGWNGQRWRLIRGNEAQELLALVLFAAASLMIFPAGLVWLSGKLFPPLSPPSSISFSTAWAIVTFVAHLSFVLWLIGEYYQIPLYVAAKIRILRSR
jgi:hypothetical protein